MKFSTKHYLFLFIALVPAMACYGQEPTPTPTATLQPTPTSTLIVGDLNQDGIVKVEDQLLLMRNWHKRTRPATAEVYSVTITIPNLPSGARPLRLIHIPPGSFLMGERNHPQSNAEPRHQVTLDYGFFIGETEVTQAQWKALMGNNPSISDMFHGVGDNYPVYYVSWDDCLSFTMALNELGQGTFRLPSEAEWEYACRGPASSLYRYDVFSFGDDPTVAKIDTYDFGPWFDQNMWWGGNCPWEVGCQPVATKIPNGYGLYDMHGSLEEWCQDFWHNNYTGAPTDGSPWLEGSSLYMVIRGGAWDCYAYDCRSAKRWKWAPFTKVYNTGLRIVRDE